MAWNALRWLQVRPVAQCQQFQEDATDASVSECTWTLSALEALCNALYKFKTYLLTYLLTLLSNARLWVKATETITTAWFSYLSSEHLYVFGLHGAVYIYIFGG